MNIIKLKVNNFEIIPEEKSYVIENQVNEFALEFEFDDSWNYETKYVIFDNEESTYKRPIINNQVIIPSELLNGRTTIQIYAQDVDNNEIVKRKPSFKYSFSILNSLSPEGIEETNLPTPSQWEIYISQIEEMCNDLQDQFDDLKEECESKCDDVIERLAQDEQDIQTNTDNIRTNAENIDKLNTDLLDYSLITETGNKISMSINSQTYVITLSLKDKNDNVLSTQSVDLPLETMIVSASYSDGVLTFTLKNGQTLQVPIEDLISGLVSTDTFNEAVQGLSNRITTIENDYLKSSDKTELQEQITANAHDIDNIQEEQLTQNNSIESLQQENERLSRIVSGLPTKNASGTNIVLNDMVNCEIKEISLKGDTLQDGTPTPSSPVEIQSVKGNQTIQCCGKNLFNKNSITNSCWLLENGTISTEHPGYDVSDYIPISPNTQYYKGNNGSLRTKYYDINKQALDTTTYQDISIGGNAGTFTTPNNAYYLRITINEATADINSFQLEKGNVATTYEEYKGTNYQVSLGTIELNKIGNYQDKIYKQNDKWYLEKNVGKYVLTGDDNWSDDATNYGVVCDNDYSAFTNYSTYGMEKQNTELVCPYFESYLFDSGFKNNGSLTSISSGGGYRLLFLRIANNYLSEVSVQGLKDFLNTLQPEIYYVYNTPVTTEITDDNLINQLEELNNYILLTNNTIISNGNLPVINDITGYVDIMSLLSTQNSRNVVEEKKSIEEPIEEPKEDER